LPIDYEVLIPLSNAAQKNALRHSQNLRLDDIVSTFNMTDLRSTFNMVKLYRYYHFGRYLYALSSFIGFFFILLNSPQRLVVLLKFAGLSHATIFSQTSFKDSCDAIEDAAIASDPRGCNLTITRCTGKMGQHKIRLHGKEENDGGRYIDGKLRYAMNDDTLVR
jgi:hypothetical protein